MKNAKKSLRTWRQGEVRSFLVKFLRPEQSYDFAIQCRPSRDEKRLFLFIVQ